MNIQPQTIAERLSERLSSLQFVKQLAPLVRNRLLKDITLLEDIAPAAAWNMKAEVYALSGNKKDAISAHKTAIRFNPSSRYYYNLAFTYELFNDINNALINYRKAMEFAGSVDIEVLQNLVNRFSALLDYQNLVSLTQKLDKLKQTTTNISILSSLLTTVFKNDKDMMLKFGLGIQEQIANYIKSRFIVATKYQKFDDNLHMIFFVHCSDDEELMNITQCNSTLSNWIVKFEEEHQIDLSTFYVYCEAVE